MKRIASLLFIAFISISGLFIQVAHGLEIETANANALVNRNSITGFIFDEANQPLADTYVELLDELYITLSRARTNGSGMYSFRGLADGRYVVKVLPYGADYEEQSRSVALISVSAVPGSGSASEQIDFYLKAKKSKNEGPLASPGVIFAQEIPDEARKLFDAGVEDLADKKEQDGFNKLKKALEVFPDYYQALDRLGREYVFRGYYQASFVLFTKAVQVNPRSFSSVFGLGLSLYRLEQYSKAIEQFQRATEIDSKQANGFLWLGISYFQGKDYTQAETALTKAKKLSDGKSADVSWQLAKVYKEQKLYGKAADELDLFLKLRPDSSNKDEVAKMIQTLRQKEASKQLIAQ